jgi:hypothetical protein
MELWDEPRPMSQAEWDQMLCELTYMGLLEEQYRPIIDQEEDEQQPNN